MECQILAPAARHRVDRRVVPHICPIAPMPAQFDHVRVGSIAHAKNEDNLVLGSIQRAHARIALVPNTQVEQIIVNLPTDHRQSFICRQSMQTKWTAPGRDTAAAPPKVSLRNLRKLSSLISPEALANSRWRPLALACPLIFTLYGDRERRRQSSCPRLRFSRGSQRRARSRSQCGAGRAPICHPPLCADFGARPE